jgi:hypothetical protein
MNDKGPPVANGVRAHERAQGPNRCLSIITRIIIIIRELFLFLERGGHINIL